MCPEGPPMSHPAHPRPYGGRPPTRLPPAACAAPFGLPAFLAPFRPLMASQEEAPPVRGPEAPAAPVVPAAGEQFLLREAFRYLKLSRPQVGRLLWIARQTERRRLLFEQEEAQERRALERNA